MAMAGRFSLFQKLATVKRNISDPPIPSTFVINHISKSALAMMLSGAITIARDRMRTLKSSPATSQRNQFQPGTPRREVQGAKHGLVPAGFYANPPPYRRDHMQNLEWNPQTVREQRPLERDPSNSREWWTGNGTFRLICTAVGCS